MRRIDRLQKTSMSRLEALGPVQRLPMVTRLETAYLLEQLADALDAGEGDSA
jgi:hypothetical protein